MPTEAPTAPSVPQSPPRVGTSTLGGANKILERFKEFKAKEAGVEPKAPVAPAPPVQEQKPSKPEEPPQKPAPEQKPVVEKKPAVDPKKAEIESILPPEKPLPSKKEEKKEEVQSTEDSKIGTDGLNKEQRAELLKFKEKAARVDELEKQAETYTLTFKERDELKKTKEELEARLKELEPAAYMHNIMLDPKYKQSFGEPMQKIESYLVKVCEKFKISPGELQTAIWNEDRFAGNEKLSELFSEMDSTSSQEALSTIQKLRELVASEREYLKNPVEAWNALEAERKSKEEQKKQEFASTYRLASEKVADAMESRFPFIKEKGLRDEILKESLEVDFDSLTPQQKAGIIQSYSVALRINPIIDELRSEIERLKKAIKDDIPPGPNDGSPESPKVEKSDYLSEEELSKMTPGQRLTAWRTGKIRQ